MPDGEQTFTEDVSPEPTQGAALPENPLNSATSGRNIDEAVENLAGVEQRIGFDQKRAQEQEIQQTHAQGVHQASLASAGAMAAVQSSDLQALHGDKGLFTTNAGPNASAAADQFMKDRDARIAKLRDTLPNDLAQQSFDAQLREHTLGVQKELGTWVDGQTKQYDTQVTGATLQNTSDAAVVAAMNEKDPAKRSDAINHQIAKGTFALIDHYERNGITFDNPKSAEILNKAIDSYTASVVERSLGALVDGGDDQGAKAFLDEHKDDLTGERAAKAKELVDKAVFQGDTRRISQSIAIDPKTNQPRSWEDMQQLLDSDKRLAGNPDLRDAVTAATARLATAQGAVERKATAQLITQASTLLVDPSNHWGPDDPRMISIREKLGGEDSPAWQTVLKTWDRIEQHRENAPSDPAAFTDATRMATDPARVQEFRTHNFQEDFANGLISHKDFDHFTQLQAESLAGGATPKADAMKAQEENFQAGMRQAGVEALHEGGLHPDASPQTWATKGAVDDFRQAYFARLAVKNQEAMAATGKPLPPEKQQAIVHEMLLDTVRTNPGYVFNGPQKPIAMLTPSERASAYESPDELRERNPTLYNTTLTNIRDQMASGGFRFENLSSLDQERMIAQGLIKDSALGRGDKATAQQAADEMERIARTAAKPRPSAAPSRGPRRIGAAFVPGIGIVQPGSAQYIDAQRRGLLQ